MSPTNQAAYLTGPKVRPLKVGSAPYTPPRDHEIVIKVHAVAVNPIDRIKQLLGDMLHGWLKYPIVLGWDVAGEVVQVGSAISRFRAGDRVLGMSIGMNEKHNESSQSGFQHYVVLKEHMTSPIPDRLAYEQAAVLPLGLSTAACGLFQKTQLGLKLPALGAEKSQKTDKTVLVWGGSTSVGLNAIQLARASGYDVIATSSPRNFDLLKRLGASQVFDYSSKTVVQDVRQAFKGKTIAGAISIGKGSALACMDVVSRCQGDKAITMASYPVPEPDTKRFVIPKTLYMFLSTMIVLKVRGMFRGVRSSFIVGDSLIDDGLGEFIYGEFLGMALEGGTFVAAPEPLVAGHGLEHAQTAIDLLGKGVSAKKVVVTL